MFTQEGIWKDTESVYYNRINSYWKAEAVPETTVQTTTEEQVQ